MIISEHDSSLVQEKDTEKSVRWEPQPSIEDDIPLAGPSSVPPPYEVIENNAPTRPLALPTPAGETSTFVAQTTVVESYAAPSRRHINGRRVNHFAQFSHVAPISGTFLVDPLVPKGPVMSRVVKMIERQVLWRDLAVDQTRLRGFGLEHNPYVNAEFRTRHADIRLAVAVVGLPPSTILRAPTGRVRGNVSAFSYNGSVEIDLFELHDDRCVDLNVFSQQGDIVVMLPPTFSGTVSTRQWQARVNLLPGFSSCKTIVSASNIETVMSLSCPGAAGNRDMQGSTADRCVIESPAGQITIGLSGVDVYDGRVRGGGLFQAIEDVVHFGAKLVEGTLRKR